MRVDRKELASGAFFIGVGFLYGIVSWGTLPMGSALNMGPGYFPIILSGILIILGAGIAIRGISTEQQAPFGIVPWRGVVMLSLATIVFAAFLDDLGLLPSVFLTTLLATLSSAQIHLIRGGFTSACVATFCTAVFSFGIHLPVPIIGPVFKF